MMAIFTTAITVPNANGLGLDLFAYNVANLATYDFFTRTATLVRFFDDANNEEVFIGTGFVFNGSGTIIGGTITGYTLRENGIVSANITGMTVAAAPVGAAIQNGNTDLFLSLMLSGNDTITGSALDDNLYFGDNAGNDTMNGAAGNDSLRGGLGNDTLNGGTDDDYIVGGAGSDTIDGGSGGIDDFDQLAYDNEYNYGAGTQGIFFNMSGTLQAGIATGRSRDSYGSIDTVSNFEQLNGTGFADTVYANVLVGVPFSFLGFSGNDTFVGTATGQDRLRYDKDEKFAADALVGRNQVLTAQGIVVNFAGDTVAGDGSSGTVTDSFGDTDTVSGVDVVRATFFVDTFNGGADDEKFHGLKGNDIIIGGGGFDIAAYFFDRVSSGVQAGGLAGITANFSGDQIADGVSHGTVVDGFGTTDQLTNIEAVDGTDFNDTFTGGAEQVEFWAGMGNDTYNGGTADDYADGGEGNDILNGGDGNDDLQGGTGADSLVGGNGWDTANYSTAGAGIVAGMLGWTNYGDAAGDTFSGVEGIYATNFADALGGDNNSNALYGNGGNDTLFGYGGSDYLYGGDGDDVLQGGTGADLLDGGTGSDTAGYDYASSGVTAGLSGWSNFGEAAGDTFVSIENLIGSGFGDNLGGTSTANRIDGSAGNDTIHGLGGADILTGGAGNDTFVWSAGDGNDFVTDFQAGAGVGDVMRLIGTGFTNFSQMMGTAGAVIQTSGTTQTEIHIGSETLYLWGFIPAQLAADDFLFS
jgi:Ca2+-binding RTX toxin-like protein